MAKKVWSNFLGGYALSPRVGVEGSYFRGKGVRIDNIPGVVENGSLFQIFDSSTNNPLVYEDHISIGNDTVWSARDDGHFNAETLDGGTDLFTLTATSGVAIDVGGMASIIETSTNTADFYGIQVGNRKDIVRRYLGTVDGDWFTTHAPFSLSEGAPQKLFGKEQILNISDGATIHQYDGSDQTFTKDALKLEGAVSDFNEVGNYLAIWASNKIHFWDMFSSSWNFEVSFPNFEQLQGIANKSGRLYAVTLNTGTKGNRYNINIYRINNDLQSYTRVAQLPLYKDLEFNFSIINISNVTSDGSNLYFVVSLLKAGTNLSQYLVCKYGDRGGFGDVLTVDHYKRWTAGGDGKFPLFNNIAVGRTDALYFVNSQRLAGEYELHKVVLGKTDATDAVFETTEFDVGTQMPSGYWEGRLKSIAVHFRESSGSGKVIAIINNTASTSIRDTISGSSPFILKGKNTPFQNLRVRCEGDLPGITRIEAEYDLKQKF